VQVPTCAYCLGEWDFSCSLLATSEVDWDMWLLRIWAYSYLKTVFGKEFLVIVLEESNRYCHMHHLIPSLCWFHLVILASHFLLNLESCLFGRCFRFQSQNKTLNSLFLKKTPWSESTSELYRPSDRRLSAKLVKTFADRRCHVVSVTDPYSRILGFLDRSRYFSFK
jgi:hypothetical protein